MTMTAKKVVLLIALLLFFFSGIVTTAMGLAGATLALIPGVVQLAIGGIGLAILVKRHNAEERR